MKILVAILLCLAPVVAKGGVIYPNQHTELSVVTNNEYVVEGDRIEIDLEHLFPTILAVDMSPPVEGFWFESFQADLISLTVTASVPISVRFIGTLENGTMAGGIYSGQPDAVALNKLLPPNNQWVKLEVKLTPMDSPGTIVVEDLIVMGAANVVPEPETEVLTLFGLMTILGCVYYKRGKAFLSCLS